ncbi:uncharacterized protein I303_104894 [Kwoniella dejecticola CBS 10117]|uniref:PH domain-containing protein n=1 Tax=Kwoniella dejecticola CBS 10117 TaxID=1296121 RepID=A0A1A6A424_9TREE|nr:uncharacterized protein I303_05660 [Kwoniella dejecticola CBS 10117]OBR84801.1 hypothetical protein I303_05660 [Kwoniella dejecticola CBS 10117]
MSQQSEWITYDFYFWLPPSNLLYHSYLVKAILATTDMIDHEPDPAPTTPGAAPPSLAQPVPAPPPSRSEVERKLSFRSATSARTHESPKKKKPTHPPPPHSGFYTSPTSGNDSDSSSITSSTQPPFIGSPNPTSPILTPATTSVGGLSAIAERKFGNEILDEMELEDVEEENEDEGDGDGDGAESASEAEEGLDGLNKGMEGERVVKSGYLWKKQERRKAWKKRWFVLRTGKLAYYKDEKEYSLKKVIDLHDVHTVAPVTVKKNPHAFGIVTPKRTFFAKASSQDDSEEWVRAINGVRRKLSEREEEERSKREKGEHHQQPKSGSIPIPTRDRSTSEAIDTTSPTSTVGSYFVNRPSIGGASTPQAVHAAGHVSPNLASGGIIPPSSPMDTTNSLTSQMAKVNVQQQPIPQSLPMRNPSTVTSMPSSRSVSGPSVSARREPSTSSIGSTAPGPPVTAERPTNLNLPSASNQFIVSSEDEDDLDLAEQSQGQGQLQNLPSTPIDPTKVILSTYLMKRSKGRGRKVWRKRWFVLTSQGVTYTKSHMDTKALRYIPLTSILDALEVDAPDQSSASEDDQPPSAHPHNHNPFHPHPHHAQVPANSASTATSPPPKSNFTNAMRGRLSTNDNAQTTPKKSSQAGVAIEKHGEENTFRLITAKRTYVLCASSEEDEIKWLAATRALLNQLRVNTPSIGQGQGSVGAAAALGGDQPRSPTAVGVPTITQQPPTPATSIIDTPPNIQRQSSMNKSRSVSASDREFPPSVQSQISNSSTSAASAQPGSMTRGRSATYMAKSAVADVVKKFHPEG